MIGNFIKYIDRNNNIIKVRILDKILVEEDSFTSNDMDYNSVVITKYLCINNHKIVTLLNPNQIKEIL